MMVTIRHERTGEVAAREALLDVSFGPVRFTKTSERLREGRLPELSFVAAEGRRLVGTVRLWDVSAGPGRPALLLGPLAVAPDCRKRGIGSTLVQQALREPRAAAIAPCCWSATHPITGGSASRARRPARCGCPDPTSSIACSPASSRRAPRGRAAG